MNPGLIAQKSDPVAPVNDSRTPAPSAGLVDCLLTPSLRSSMPVACWPLPDTKVSCSRNAAQRYDQMQVGAVVIPYRHFNSHGRRRLIRAWLRFAAKLRIGMDLAISAPSHDPPSKPCPARRLQPASYFSAGAAKSKPQQQWPPAARAAANIEKGPFSLRLVPAR